MSKSFTDNFIADTYTGILHSDLSLPTTGQVEIYDGVGNITALKLGQSGKGANISGNFTADSAQIPTIYSNSLNSTVIESVTINATKITSSEITTSSLSASGSVVSSVVTCTTLNSTNLTSSNASVGNLTITSGTLTVANITNTNLTSSNITSSNITGDYIKSNVNITSDTINVRDIGSTGNGFFNQFSANRVVTGSLNSGNIEYPTSSISTTLFGLIYPVGSVYLSVTNTNPETLFAGTTWVNTANGLFLVGAGTGTDSNGVTRGFNIGANAGGEYQHTLTTAQMPSHKHTGYGVAISSETSDTGDKWVKNLNQNIINHQDDGHTATQAVESAQTKRDNELILDNTGGGAAHNVTPPSFGVYVWQRTA
jgi:microcystin-dependent protein